MSERISAEQAAALVARIRHLGHLQGLMRDGDITQKAEIGSSALSDLKRCQGKGPTLGTLLSLCRALDVYSVDELLGFSASTFFHSRPQVDALLDRAGRTLKQSFYDLLGGD